MGKKLGFIVDGPGDFAAVNARFGAGCKILKTGGPRSHSTTAEQIASYSRKEIEILRLYGCSHVVVIVDFEERQGSWKAFAEELNQLLSTGYEKMEVRAVVPNRMIENWFLADVTYLSSRFRFLKRQKAQKRFEGTNGKRELKRLFSKKESYQEVKHGRALFPEVRLEEAGRLSDSLLDLINALIDAGQPSLCSELAPSLRASASR